MKLRSELFRNSKIFLINKKIPIFVKLYNMVVISYGTLRSFFELHADAEDALNNWYRLTIMAEWANYHEIKKMFNAVDAVGNDRYVFNIRGNNYRLVAMIFFDVRTVYIRFIGYHAEYNRLKDCSLV
jgi:mRNA interferase HigB